MLRFLCCVLAALAFPTGAFGQQPAGRVVDIDFRVLDLQFRVLDVVLPDLDIAGGPKSLEVEETETEIRVALSADVLFDFDSSDIKPEAAEALTQVAALLMEHADQPVRIEGHTDSKGADAYNLALSEDRALSVKEWLQEEADVDGSKFEIVGFGEKNPVAPNEHPDGTDDPDGRQKNRRVEIVIGKSG
jgi:outer membrane protein OmpA-like peptidoglycan-associated protein